MAICGFVLFLQVATYFDGSSIYWDLEEYLMLAGWFLFTIVTTYILDILVDGVKNDVAEIKKMVNEKKTKKA